MSNTAAYTGPEEIERRSFEIIREELEKRRASDPRRKRSPAEEAVLTRVIHATADFDYDERLLFTHDAAEAGTGILRAGTRIVTDTQMALAGINKAALARYGGEARCFMADADVAETARARGITRASAAVDKAAALDGSLVFAVGNAPTALIRLHELIRAGTVTAQLVIAVPVGFVNVEESKELFTDLPIPCIIARGRKGGSTVAAAIVNALLYMKE
ncbi:MAG: precorrin-8X methylmutase, partial [Spirochaetaceae bacterium]|nr:precorrin-8X methylmutase [Spirochaetaceae bacterium]